MQEDHYAVLDGDTVANVVVCDDPGYAAAQGWQPLPEGVWIGWTYDGASWVPPPEPDPPAE